MPYPYFTAPPPSGDLTGATDWTNLTAAIAQTPDNGVLLYPSPAAYYLNARLNVFSRAGLRLLSMGQPDTLAIGKRGTEFVWKGPADIDSLLSLNYAHRCSVEGIAISCDGSTTPPACGIRVDQWPDPSMPKPSITTTTACDVSRCLVTAPAVTPLTVSTFHGLDFSQVSQQNVDLMRVFGCIFNGGAEGSRTGSSSNAKGYTFARCQFNNCGVGIHFISGSAGIEDCTAQSCGVDIQNDALVDFFHVRRWNSEGTGLALSVQGSSGIARMEQCRFAGLGGTAAIWHRNGPGLILEGNYFQGVVGPAPALIPTVTPFQLPAAGLPAITAAKLHCSGNRWYQMLPKVTQQFGYVTQGMPDSEA
jgi:hypothetical protein